MKFLSTICFILLTNLIFSQNTLSTIVKDSRRTAGPVPVSQGLFTINTSAARSTSVLGKHLHKYTPLRINATELKRVFNAHPQKLDLQLPIDGQPAELELVRTYLYAAGSKVFDSEGHEINYTPPVTYYGTVKGLPNSVVSVVVFEQDFVAMIADGKTSNAIITKDGLTDADRFIQYRDGDVKEANPIQCATPDKPLSGRELEEFRAKTQNRVLGNRSLGCIVMDVEFTHSTYTTYSNNSTNLLNWFNGVFAGVHTLYNNEQINLIMGATKINTSASEYGGGQYSTNPGTALDQFMVNAAGNSNFQGSFAHLIRQVPNNTSTTSIAYVDALCSTFGIAYSTPYPSYNAYPGYSWSVDVVAHESGHVFGSPHTHACVWNGNNTAIDGCGPNVGFSEGCTGPIPSKGTIMSYCHYPGNGNPGIDFSLGFGTQPGNVIRAGATSANCANNCAPAGPTCTDGIQNGDEAGVDCGGSDCIPCNPNCLNPSQFTGISASQSTTWGGISASGAIDNNLSTTNHTTAELNPWLQLDLGASKLVTRIAITNRSGCPTCVNEKRLEKFRVYVSNSPTSPTNEVFYNQTVIADGATVNITGLDATGRYIRIKSEYTSANYLHLAEVKVYGCTVDVCSGNTAPGVSITTASTTFPAGTSLSVNANASDANNLISGVEFYNGTSLIGTDYTSPYSITLTPSAPTSYTITAKAIDECGATTTSSAVIYNATVTCSDGVKNGTETGVDCGGTCTACTSICSVSSQFTTGLSATQSTSWSGISAGGAIDNNLTTTNHTNAELMPWLQIDLGASKNITAIDIINRAGCPSCVTSRRLEKFKVYVSNSVTPSIGDQVISNTVLIADGATVSVTGLSASGRYVRVWAEYTTANYLHLAEVKIYGCDVNACANNTAPIVNITTPAASFIAGSGFTVSATASDNGNISMVEFYNGANMIGSDDVAPYSIVLSSPSPTTYTITAKAYDNCGSSTNSSQVSYTSTQSCSDGVINGTETGVDCGGTCTACTSICAVSSQFTTGLSATQSTSWSGTSAGGAIDNNLTTTNHTNAELMPWLQIDLGASKNITAIDIINRAGCPSCVTSRRLEKFKVYVSNSVTPSSGDQVFSNTVLIADGATVSVTGLSATGRYVRVWAEYTAANYLHLAEVKIYGCDVNACANNTAPIVNITTPAASFIAGSGFTVSATASDNGNISMVEFYNGANMIGSDDVAPYSIVLSSPSPTTYTITAKAYDNCGSSTNSSQVSYTSTQSCSDGVKNGTETGVDCGGTCLACTNACTNSTQFTAGVSASQSTTWPGSTASAAIDNNLSTTNHTNAELMPWLQLNLGSSKVITNIDVVNRSGCPSCVSQKRLERFKVYISNSITPTSGDLVYTHTALVGDGATVNINNLNATGQYVRVWAEYSTANYLHVAEVKVFGCNTGSDVASNENPGQSISDDQPLNVEIYPNPTIGDLIIRYSANPPSSPTEYRLYDLMGRVILQGVLTSDHLNLRQENNGYYLLELRNGHRRFTQKIIKI